MTPLKLRKLASLLVVCAVLVFAALLYAMRIEPYWLHIDRKVIQMPNLPKDMRGLRIAFVADTHFSRFFREKDLERLVTCLAVEKPDLILLGGDASETGEWLQKTLKALSALEPTHGIYGVIGNHEIYFAQKELDNRFLLKDQPTPSDIRAYVRSLYASTNVTFLMDEQAIVQVGHGRLAIIGTDYMPETKVVQGLVDTAQDAEVRILVAHTPDTLTRWQQAGGNIDALSLTLSGHTHGGQVTFLGLWAPLKPTVCDYEETLFTGWRKSGECWELTSNGYGMTGMPVRFFARPQIHMIDLE